MIKPVVRVAAVLLLVVSSGCTRDEPPVVLPSGSAASTSATPPVTPTPTVSRSPQQQALDAYTGMWLTYLKAAETADPDHPDLARHATGKALETLRSGLQSMRDKGLRGRGHFTFRAVVESAQPAANPTLVRVRDCLDTSKTGQYKANGEPYTDPPGGNRLTLADVELVDGEWKVRNFGVRDVGTCTG